MNELCHAFLKFFEEGHNWWMKCYKGLFTDVLHRCKMQKWWMKLSLRLFNLKNVKSCKSDAGMNECASAGLFKLNWQEKEPNCWFEEEDSKCTLA
jgi:hypothetical protein